MPPNETTPGGNPQDCATASTTGVPSDKGKMVPPDQAKTSPPDKLPPESPERHGDGNGDGPPPPARRRFKDMLVENAALLASIAVTVLFTFIILSIFLPYLLNYSQTAKTTLLHELGDPT